MSYFEGSRFKHVHDFGMVIFEIVGIRDLDLGQYTCVASNKAGKAETSFNLKVQDNKEINQPKFTSQLKVTKKFMIYFTKVKYLQ